MRKLVALTLAAGFLLQSVLLLPAGSAWDTARVAAAQPPPGGPPLGGPPPGGMQPGGMQRPGGPMGFMGAPMDSFVAERDSLAKEVLANIKGREHVAAESVFKNIKVMKGFPAGRLVQAMNMGFGRALGTRCQTCHVLGHWDDEDKKPKQIAREMMAMSRFINDSLMSKIKFEDENDHPHVSCFTCHHGQLKPAEMGPTRPQR